jgi:hypothetical protein
VMPAQSIESQVHRVPEGGSEEGLIHSDGSR